jgi:FtsH-binding integral membrane protein
MLLVAATLLVSPHLFAQDLLLLAAPLLVLVLSGARGSGAAWVLYGLVAWVLTFLHFDLFLRAPDERSINFVSTWLFVGLLLAGLGAPAVRMIARTPKQVRVRTGGRAPAHVLLAVLFALTLSLLAPGLAGQRLASAITYSYTVVGGETFRVPLPGIARDGLY